MKKLLAITMILVMMCGLIGCDTTASTTDRNNTVAIGDRLAETQPTPTDIEYSLERYNLIRRAYWVNGQREKARTVPQPLADVPLGYCILFTGSGAVVGSFVVDGKVTSLNSYLSPNAYDEYVANGGIKTIELPDVDGSYGENDNGIFFFTPDGRYIEWTGTYLYSDIPFEVSDPVLKVGANNE